MGRHRHLAAILGLVAGAGCGAFVVGLAGAEVRTAAAGAEAGALHAAHLPPLLRLPGEPAELRYDVYCVSEPAESTEKPCAASGSVFLRPGTSGPFSELRLTEVPGADEGRFRAIVPASITRARDGFSYYASFRSDTGERALLPEAGASAPQLSLILDKPADVGLGSHRFGRVLPPAARVAEAAWGEGSDAAGLERGTDSVPIGPSSFDVGRDGAVHLLDQARRRVLRWRAGAARPSSISVGVNGTIADLALADDGTMHVLESTGSGARGPLLRVFGAGGQAVSATEVGEGLSQVRVGPAGSAVVHRPASGQWLSATREGRAVAAAARSASGRPGRPLKEGGAVTVLRTADEIRVALVPERGRARSWRITSETPLAEVQLAEPLGSGLVIVARVYTGSDDEFLVLVLDDRGLASMRAVASPGWAEAAPLSRFRLAGSSLYRLGSDARGVFVDRFDLEAPGR